MVLSPFPVIKSVAAKTVCVEKFIDDEPLHGIRKGLRILYIDRSIRGD